MIDSLYKKENYICSVISENEIKLIVQTTIKKTDEIPYNISVLVNGKEYFYEEKRVFPYTKSFISKENEKMNEINGVYEFPKEFVEKIVSLKNEKIKFRFNTFCSQDFVTYQNVSSLCKKKLVKEFELTKIEKNILKETIEYYYLRKIKKQRNI